MGHIMKIRIGTRASKLALIQAELVKSALLTSCSDIELEIEIIPITTTGDKILELKLAEMGGKGLFTKELEEALLANHVDIAVHSFKDMPIILPEGLKIAAVLEREDPHDALLCNDNKTLYDLDQGVIIGTSSSRRKALLLNFRSDFNIVNFRGNVQTRLAKLKQKAADATVLAIAGLKRLKIDPSNYQIIPFDIMLPAVAQGVICIESRSNDIKINSLLTKINHQQTELCMKVERAFLHTLEGDCSTPIAGLAILNDNKLSFQGCIASPDGKVIYKDSDEAEIEDAHLLGITIAKKLLHQGPSLF